MGLFQYINFNYLSLFKSSEFEGLSGEELTLKIEENIAEYNKVQYYGTLFSGTLFLHLVGKFIYNVFADLKMPIDKWTMIDIVTCFFNIICFNVIGSITEEQITDPAQK